MHSSTYAQLKTCIEIKMRYSRPGKDLDSIHTFHVYSSLLRGDTKLGSHFGHNQFQRLV